MNLTELINKFSTEIKESSGSTVKILNDESMIEISTKKSCSIKDVVVEALKLDIYPHRYLRNKGSITNLEQIKLANATVAIIGAGGLGGYVITELARAGIGCLKIADYDSFEESNLNRQALSRKSAIGKEKVKIAAHEIDEINPIVKVDIYTDQIHSDNVSNVLKGADVVIDALDNIADRMILETASKDLKIPFVHGAIAGFEGRIMTIFPEDKGLELLYGKQDDESDPHQNNSLSSEKILGTPTFTPAVVASFQAMEAVKILLNKGRLFRKTMVHFDLLNGSIEKFTF